MDGYWSSVNTLRSYYDTNMDFLKPEVSDHFFAGNEWEIYTKVEDNPSAKYNSGARVRNSLVSSGCIINGVVEDSILFKKVYIGDNCDVLIVAGCGIDNCGTQDSEHDGIHR